MGEGASVAYDFAWECLEGSGRRGRLNDEIWGKAAGLWGKKATLALLHYVGVYAYTCILLNGAGVQVPEGESIKKPLV